MPWLYELKPNFIESLAELSAFLGIPKVPGVWFIMHSIPREKDNAIWLG